MTSGGPVKQEVWAPPCPTNPSSPGMYPESQTSYNSRRNPRRSPSQREAGPHRTGPQADPPSGAKPHARGHLRGWYLSYY